MRRKLAITFFLVAAVLFALSVYLLFIMRNRGEEYQRKILTQQGYTSDTVSFRRGNITDRNQTVLAYSEEVYNLILDPSVILYTAKETVPQPNRSATVTALVTVLGLDKTAIDEALDKNPNSAYIRFVRKLSAEKMNAFVNYQNEYNNARDENGKKLHGDKVTGVWFEKDYERTYPYGTLACTVLGFSGAESSEGHWGLEEYYNDTLSGTNGKTYSFINAEGDYETLTEAAKNGCTLVTTLDYTVQKLVEEKIAEFCADNIYTNVGVVVMDPNTAEILAMATDKKYDPGDPTDLSQTYPEADTGSFSDEQLSAMRSEMWRNFTVSDAYTPGSVGKELTVATALEENVVTKDEVFLCDGGETFQGTVIGCNSVHGENDLTGTLMWSCNDAMMQISTRLSVASFLKYQRSFGLGQKTGIDLPGETPGIIYTESNMQIIDKATSSFGQAYSVNMVQMAAAYASLVNGGYYYKPHIVRQILDENGGVVRNIDPVPIRQTVTQDTCEFIREAAFQTIENGSAYLAAVKGYKVGGKTGTAQKYPLEEQKYVISFLSFAPSDDPAVIVYVVIDEPESDGREVSNHAALLLNAAINSELLPYLGLPKTNVQMTEQE